MKFRQKLLEIEAIQNTGDNLKEIEKFIMDGLENKDEDLDLHYDEDKNILTHDDELMIPFNDWISCEDGEYGTYTTDGLNYLYEPIK